MKKINPIKSLLIYLSLGLCLTACEEDNTDPDNPDPDNPAQAGCQLTKVMEEGDDEYGEVAYNAQGYSTKLITKEPGSNATDEYTLFTYNTNNQLVKMENYDDGLLDDDYATFEYTDNLLTTINNYDGSTLESVTTLKYVTDKRVIEYSSDEEGDAYKTTYTYDSKGNVTKEEYFNSNALTSSITYENYDDKHTPYSVLKGVPNVITGNLSQNNAGKMTYSYDSDGDGVIQPGESSDVTTYTYEYNSDGYPTKITETDVDGDTDVTALTYQCE